jgi:tRNA (cytidine/uridine-2'-O-)-methyltransferase
MVGQESSGVPPLVHAAADVRVRVAMAPGRRSLNVVTALAIVLGEALRQTGGFAGDVAARSHAV